MEDAEMDGWVMAVGRKRRLQSLAKDHQDLSFFCPDKRGQRHPGLPESLTVLNEIPEAMTSMLNAPVCKFLTENEERVDYLFFSDQYTGPKPPQDEAPSAKLPVTQKVLIFAFRVGNKGNIDSEEMEVCKSLFHFIFYIVEKVHRLRLSKEAKTKSERNRQRAHDSRLKSVHSQRQEAAQSRREERMRAVKERIMSEEDPDKARKLEEREQRKEKAKKMPRIKMLKSKGP
ncbi:Coiled-coil domain-containing protein 47 [Fasciola gigantica]|uniref:PAT complex subunit CCDC47 n=2 Tax=Fasciola TaxID=6191 RepID=A0A504Z1J7_FASGI|nr:Coiled-coil domain-containing protein 47 [Fasciola gigantica]